MGAQPLYTYAKEKTMYIFSIKPGANHLKDDKYLVWSGLVLYEAFHPHKITDDYLQSYFGTRHKLLKCFEALGFNYGEFASPLDLKKNTYAERAMKNFEIRQRFEGFLEKKRIVGLEFFNSGYYLMALISALQEEKLNRDTINDHLYQFSSNWKKVQKNLSYKLPQIELAKYDKTYINLTQPELMTRSLDALKAIKSFYGKI
jgi:hypothetical protein